MSRKFDVVIGNPPYQEDSVGESTHNMPIYDKFMDAAYEVGTKAVLITPARFLFNAGYTNKDWNAKMLADPHVSVPIYVPNSGELFPGTDIKGGVVVTYRDASKEGEPIGTFTKYPELNSILHRVSGRGDGSLTQLEITNDRQYRFTDLMHSENPQARSLMSEGNPYKPDARTFTRLPFLWHASRPEDGHQYAQILGRFGTARTTRWIRRAYIDGPQSFDKFKVAVPKANGSGTFGETLSQLVVLDPGVGVQGTFITIGAFDSRDAAEACEKYIKSKFARTMLGVSKVTQDNPARTWKHVPLQDFTDSSDIDWNKSIPEIDAQLYAKYGLDAEEIAFVEANVKPME
ncbi:restriction endonuclease [Nocardioides guangzhouensis]|uniref:Restriction endonuclease n=1 Tax=Nocardioides guangzhouensis TaxID=2497878 RepID=A0A4V1Y014_9ACTN|nr:Eco57I restriction-modification methylase domain-containing protein [Nocardioides guangzhouensis]RYP88659.1 restriction endonuclease [Nocardioides guangzhouensis]